MDQNIAIIGGGITGLTTALALHKTGYECTVYEQAKALNAVGAGILLQPNALKVFKWLGIYDDIIEAGVTMDKMDITDVQLEPFQPIEADFIQDLTGTKLLAIHRSRLQQVLYDQVVKNTSIELGKKYVSHTNNGKYVEVKFENSTHHFDALLGADGINSEVRSKTFINSPTQSSNQYCWRGISSLDLPEEFVKSGREAWGKGVRFGFMQVHKKEVYWFAVTKALERFNGLRKDELKEIYSSFHPIVGEIISSTPNDKIHFAELADLKRLKSWSNERVCLIGDAAHATTPNMGQGACQGIEDAYYLSQALKDQEGFESAFQDFEHKRRKKVDHIVKTSRHLGAAAHHPIGQMLIRFFIKTSSKKTMTKQLNKLYDVDGLT